MAVTWTTIPNGDVDVDSPLSTALMTALRDNPEGIAQRAVGAPKIFGVPYDYQEFTSAGTWTKPNNAESGDVVVVQVVGGGGSGARHNTAGGGGGGGGGGACQRFDDIDLLPASVSIPSVGAGASGRATNGNGSSGGVSEFGVIGDFEYLRGNGGSGAFAASIDSGAGGPGGSTTRVISNGVRQTDQTGQNGGDGGQFGREIGGSSITGGGGGGGANNVGGAGGGPSMMAGGGGQAFLTGSTSPERDGMFPGGGGGGAENTTSGDGADGVVRVWCIREA